MDDLHNFDIDSILKVTAAEENSALNFEKWKADILATAQFLEPATNKFENRNSSRIYEFTRRHGTAILASAAALLITFSVGSTLLSRKSATAPEEAMPQAAQIAETDEAVPEIYSIEPAQEFDDAAEGEQFAYGIANDDNDTITGDTGEAGSTGGAGKSEKTAEEPAEPPKTDILPAQDFEGAAGDPKITQSITNEVKVNAVDAIINALALNDVNTSGYNYDNANIIVVQHGEYTYGPLVSSSPDVPPKTSGEYEGPVFIVTFTLPDWTIKQYALSTMTYEVLGEVTFG